MHISLTLIISGDLLNPEEITSILNITPHVSKRKGDIKILKSQKNIVAKFGLWEWRSRDLNGILSLKDHVEALSSTLSLVKQKLFSLPNAQNVWIDLHFVTKDNEPKNSSITFLIEPETIAALYKMGLPVEITVDI
jgi:hypothetical protein